MKILFLQEQPCIRSLKYAVGLRSYDSNVRLIFGFRGLTLNEFYGRGDELFDACYRIHGDVEQEITSIVKRVKPDLIHCHNAPDALTVASINVFKGVIPIVHDIHDLLSLRNTQYDDGLERDNVSPERIRLEEKIALVESDGVVAVSEAILMIAEKKYNLDQKERLVFPNYVIEDMVPLEFKEKLSYSDGLIHIVYEGHLDSRRSGGHYDLFQIFQNIARQGIHLHIYPSKENELHKDLGRNNDFIHYHRHMSLHELMTEITQYDFGWSGFNTQKNRAHADTVLANKTFEYIAAGLPVITFPHRSQKYFIEKHRVGIVIDNLGDLEKKLSNRMIKDVKKQVLRNRFSFTVEGQIDKIYNFYEKILNSAPT